jgi:hypothetical protein
MDFFDESEANHSSRGPLRESDEHTGNNGAQLMRLASEITLRILGFRVPMPKQ